MRSAFTLLFLIAVYNFLLWHITTRGLSPIPLFPEDPFHIVMVLSYSSVLYVSWLFGERERSVQWIGYLFFFQIIAMSLMFNDLGIIVRDLPPVIFTIAIVSLFESPTETERKRIEKEREELLKEIDKIARERQKVEVHLRMLKQEIENIEKKSAGSDEDEREALESRLKELQRELEEYREKANNLLDTNRRLFQMLDMLKEGDTESVSGELASLRRERKKLIKELIQLQELVQIYEEENSKLKDKVHSLREELNKVKVEKDKIAIELENASQGGKDRTGDIIQMITDMIGVELTERSLDELIKLPPDKRKVFLKELMKFTESGYDQTLEPLASIPSILKFKFSGGRMYFVRDGDRLKLVGLIGSEDDKDKDRYIKNVLSKIGKG